MNKLLLGMMLSLLGISMEVDAQNESAKRKAGFNLAKSGLAVQGYDVVNYFANAPQKGSPKYAYTYQDVVYHFANAGNLEKFKAAPSKYEPAYGGWCAYAMAEGRKVEVDPKTYKIKDGKLLLFYHDWWTNTLTLWNKDEAALYRKSEAAWTKIYR